MDEFDRQVVVLKQAPGRGADHTVERFFEINVNVVRFGAHLEGLKDRENVVRSAAAFEASHLGGVE